MHRGLQSSTLLALLLAASAACGGAPPVAEPKAQPPVNAKEATKGATDAVTSIYESIGQGDSDGLMTLASEKLVVFGPRRGDALANRTDALVALGKEVSAKQKAPVGGSTLQIVPAPGGHSAWAFDVVDVGGGPLVVTAVLTNTDDIWLVEAAALARTPTAKKETKELARDAIVPPGMSGVAAVKSDSAAKAAADRLVHALGAQSELRDDLATHSEALVVGPTAGEVTRGKKDIKKLWKKRLKMNTRETMVGEVAAATTPDGRLAWASVPVTRTSDDGPPLPLRVFAIYEKHDASWSLIALQESIAVDEAGAGAAMAKKGAAAVPAAAPAAKPDADAAPAADPAPAPKKHKKKHAAPPPTDDGADQVSEQVPPKHKKKHRHADDDGDGGDVAANEEQP